MAQCPRGASRGEKSSSGVQQVVQQKLVGVKNQVDMELVRKQHKEGEGWTGVQERKDITGSKGENGREVDKEVGQRRDFKRRVGVYKGKGYQCGRETTKQWVTRTFYAKLKKRRKMRWEPKKTQSIALQSKGSIDEFKEEDKVEVLGMILGEEQDVEVQRNRRGKNAAVPSISAGKEAVSEEVEHEEEACISVADNEVIGREENMQVLNKVNAWVERCSEGVDGDFVASADEILDIHQKRMRDKYKAAEFTGRDAEKVVVDRGQMSEVSKVLRAVELDKDDLKKASVSLMKKLSKWEKSKEKENNIRGEQEGKGQSKRGKDKKQVQKGTCDRRFTESALKQNHI